MEDTKVWWQSRGIISGIVSVAAIILNLVFQKTLSSGDQATIVDVILQITAAIGSAMSVYYRATATQEITLTRK